MGVGGACRQATTHEPDEGVWASLVQLFAASPAEGGRPTRMKGSHCLISVRLQLGYELPAFSAELAGEALRVHLAVHSGVATTSFRGGLAPSDHDYAGRTKRAPGRSPGADSIRMSAAGVYAPKRRPTSSQFTTFQKAAM